MHESGAEASKHLALIMIVVACNPRDTEPAAPRTEPKRDGANVAGARDAGEERIVRDRLSLAEQKPPADVVLFKQNGWDLYIDKTEVTVGAYRECVEAGVCSEPGPDAVLKPYREAAEDNPNRAITRTTRLALAEPLRSRHRGCRATGPPSSDV